MVKSFFEEMGGTYHEENGYLIPDLTLPTEEKTIGIWEQRHLRYIKEHKRLFYVNLLTSGKLNSYIANTNEQAEELFFRLVKEMTKKQKITEYLKATDQMLWVGKMNTIRNADMEIVNKEISIFIVKKMLSHKFVLLLSFYNFIVFVFI